MVVSHGILEVVYKEIKVKRRGRGLSYSGKRIEV
jgi:hypothetical protein